MNLYVSPEWLYTVVNECSVWRGLAKIGNQKSPKYPLYRYITLTVTTTFHVYRPNPFIYFPFGLGHRSCIGKVFAMVRFCILTGPGTPVDLWLIETSFSDGGQSDHGSVVADIQGCSPWAIPATDDQQINSATQRIPLHSENGFSVVCKIHWVAYHISWQVYIFGVHVMK